LLPTRRALLMVISGFRSSESFGAFAGKGKKPVGKKAFTLMELLVVIAIIAMLISILVPALRAARDQGRRIHCLANVKTLTLAWLMYKDDNGDKLVRGHTGDVWQPDDWVHSAQGQQSLEQKLRAIREGALYRYTGKAVEVYRCPADRRIKNLTLFCYRSFSIANGANGEDWPGDHVPVKRYSNIKNPSMKYIFLEDIDPRGDNVGSWQIHYTPQQWIDPLAMWHNRRSTLGFADGHSEMHQWHDKSFIDWSQKAMDNDPGFVFGMTPPASEREDYNFMAKGFPCKSHN
jgi:prepilin-type N-terminal cleavage/methylation domain-containing protein/prepilin-type processing-associated H-X9-DG protein